MYFRLVLVILAALVFSLPAVPSFASPTASPVIASIFSFSGKQPDNLGVKSGLLNRCPKTPNCVSSQSSDTTHRIDPITYEGDAATAFDRLKEAIEGISNAKIITAEPDYLYAQFTSRIMGFVDDVEFYLDEDNGAIQVRSASRLGESDLGVNRKRIEKIRKLLES